MPDSFSDCSDRWPYPGCQTYTGLLYVRLSLSHCGKV